MNYRPPNSVFKYGGICLCWLLTATLLRMLCSEHQKPNVYHPIDNPNSRSDLYLLKNSECPFIQHDSVLKLNDLRTLSVNRILYKQKNGQMDIHSDEYKNIEKLVLAKYFPEFLYGYNQTIKRYNELVENTPIK